jgi:hypothetical protein
MKSREQKLNEYPKEKIKKIKAKKPPYWASENQFIKTKDTSFRSIDQVFAAAGANAGQGEKWKT